MLPGASVTTPVSAGLAVVLANLLQKPGVVFTDVVAQAEQAVCVSHCHCGARVAGSFLLGIVATLAFIGAYFLRVRAQSHGAAARELYRRRHRASSSSSSSSDSSYGSGMRRARARAGALLF